MNRTATITVDKNKLKELNKILRRRTQHPEYKRDSVIETFTADFGDGYQADIKVCNGEGPYVDPVLFDEGCEATTGDVTDKLDGEYQFDYGDDHFTVIVKVQ